MLCSLIYLRINKRFNFRFVADRRAKQFIDGFRRFIARRGCPREMLSDNGSAFTAEDTQTFVGERNIKWHFSLTQATWYSGIWERLVQSVKRLVGQANLKLF